MNNLESLISYGNSKLPRNTAIFNMNSATDCPSKARGLCQLCDVKKCYAMKAELQYSSVLPYRRRQEKLFNRITPDQFASDLALINKRKRSKIKYLRISEAGDLKDQGAFNKIDQIAGLLSAHNIKVYIYSKTGSRFQGA